MADDKIIIGIELDDGTVKKAFVKMEDAAKLSGQKAGKSLEDGMGRGADAVGKRVSGAFKGFAIAAAAYFSASAVKGLFGNMIAEAKKQENSIFAMNNALRLTGLYSKETSADLQVYASKLQSVSKFGDDAVLSSMSLIQTLGNLSKNELKRATAATVDFASAMRIDLNTASMAMSKAAAGNFGALTRYTGALDPAIMKTKDFGALLGELEKRFGGSGLAALKTFDGATTSLSNSFGDFLETFGLGVTTSPVVIMFINKIKDAIVALTPSADSVRDAVNGMMISFLNMAKIGATYIVPVFEQIFNVIKSVGVGIGAIVSAVVSAASGDFKQALETFKSGAMDIFGNERGWGGILFDFKASMNISESVDKLISDANIARDSVAPVIENMAARSKTAINSISEASKQLGQTFKNSVVGGIVGGVQNIVSSIMKGENAFANFGKFVLGVFGDMATNMGTVLIASGIGIEALKSLGGAAAIAAGIGLVAVGQVLKSLSGGAGTDASAVGGMGGGSFGASSMETETLQDERLATDEPRTQVNLRIDGNVFNTEETAQSIADLLNDAFDQKGVRIRTA